MGKVVGVSAVLLWTILFLVSEQGSIYAGLWMGVVAWIFFVIALFFIFLGLCARRRGAPFFVVSALPLLLACVFAFMNHEEYKTYQLEVQRNQATNEKVYDILLGRM